MPDFQFRFYRLAETFIFGGILMLEIRDGRVTVSYHVALHKHDANKIKY